MDRKRILELALQTLQRQKAEVDTQIDKIKLELKGSGSTVAKKPKSTATKIKKKRKMTAAQRKAQSEKMKKVWAERKKSKK